MHEMLKKLQCKSATPNWIPRSSSSLVENEILSLFSNLKSKNVFLQCNHGAASSFMELEICARPYKNLPFYILTNYEYIL
jgi:hypothetical protein